MTMKLSHLLKPAVYLFISMSSSPASGAEVSVVFTKELADIPGKTGQILTVEYAPGESSRQHRHNADTFVYVLEGAVVMAVRGGKEKVLTQGQTFYETPDDIHTVAKNASATEPAKILVFFVKNTGAPASIPVP